MKNEHRKEKMIKFEICTDHLIIERENKLIWIDLHQNLIEVDFELCDTRPTDRLSEEGDGKQTAPT